MQVRSKSFIKTVMGALSYEVEIHISEGRHKTIRGFAFPVVSVHKTETDPVINGQSLTGNQAREKTTRMALFHGKRLFPSDEHFRLDCLGVKTAHYNPFFSCISNGVYAENAVRIRMLDPYQSLDVLWEDPFQQRFFGHNVFVLKGVEDPK
jgi:hypothetical protein